MTTPDPYRPGQPFPSPQGPTGYPVPIPGQPGQFYPQQVPQPGQPFPQQPQQPYGNYPQPVQNYGQPQQFPQQGNYPQPVQQYSQPGQYPQQPAGFPQPNQGYPNQGFPQPGNGYASPQFPGGQFPQPQQYAQPQFPQPQQPSFAQPQFPQSAAPQAFAGFPSQPNPFPSAPVSPAQQPFPTSAASPIPISARQVVPSAPVSAPAAAPVPLPASPTKVAAAPTASTAVVPRSVAKGSDGAAAAAGNRPMPLGSRPLPVTDEAKKKQAVVRQATEEDKADEEDKKLEKVATKSAPPWLVSMVVHLVIIIGLALIVFALPRNEVVEIISAPPDVYAEDLGEQLKEELLQSPTSMEMEVTDPALSLDSNPVNDPFAAPPEVTMVDILNATTSTSDISAPSIGMALSGREKGAKSALLAAYGGNATTEAAVREGLLWLKKQQKADGSWSLMGPYDGQAGVENVCSATAMALLAFQGHGDTHKDGEFKDVVKWLGCDAEDAGCGR